MGKSVIIEKRAEPAKIKKFIETEKRRSRFVLNLFNGDFNKKVLDVGCGLGVLLNELRKKGAEVKGVDINPIGKELFKLDIKKMDLNKESLPFKNKEFDVVVCVAVLEDLFDMGRALSEIKRVLKDDGFAILSYSNLYHIENRLKVLLGLSLGTHHKIDIYANHYFVPPKEMKEFIEKDFKIIKSKNMYYLNKKWFTYLLYPLKIILPGLFVTVVALKCVKN